MLRHPLTNHQRQLSLAQGNDSLPYCLDFLLSPFFSNPSGSCHCLLFTISHAFVIRAILALLSPCIIDVLYIAGVVDFADHKKPLHRRRARFQTPNVEWAE